MKDIECPLCRENLRLNKEGTMTNKKTGEFIYVMICDECDQAFGLEGDKIPKLIPYDAKMKLIENKCKICNKIENYNEKGLFLLNVDSGYYEFHCFDCSKPILQKWIDNNSKSKKMKVSDKNLQDIYEIYDFNSSNEMLKQMRDNPEKYAEQMEKFQEDFKKGAAHE